MPKKISAVVAAYNEAKRIGPVLAVLTRCPQLTEIIVVDDGSTDNTIQVIKQYPVTLIEQRPNKGKGRAMELGVKNSTGEIIFFCDADISGLTPQVVERIIAPVLNAEKEMYIGMRDRPIHHLPLLRQLVPLLGGERALTRELWNLTPQKYKQHFEIEAALNFYAKRSQKGLAYTVLPEVSQVIKEKKYGWWVGSIHRYTMGWQILKTWGQLQFDYIFNKNYNN